MIANTLVVRFLGQTHYTDTWAAMQQFTNERSSDTIDEIWFLEHDPVFTQGQNGKPEHILNPGGIPIVNTDRGGQVTYHGPGQLMVYTLLDLKRKQFTVRDLVSKLEQSVIDLLQALHIPAYAKREAPGVYLQEQQSEKKICSIGLRIRRGYSYHGIAFNINLDLEPFTRINPCGYANLQMAQLAQISSINNVSEAAKALLPYLQHHLAYTHIETK